MFKSFLLAAFMVTNVTKSALAEDYQTSIIEMYYDFIRGTYTVPVTISNGVESNNLTITFDTGSSYSALPLSEVKKLNLEPAQRVQAYLGDGTTVPLTLYALPNLTVGNCEITDTHVLGIPKALGILGMNDLARFKQFTFETGRLIIQC